MTVDSKDEKRFDESGVMFKVRVCKTSKTRTGLLISWRYCKTKKEAKKIARELGEHEFYRIYPFTETITVTEHDYTEEEREEYDYEEEGGGEE